MKSILEQYVYTRDLTLKIVEPLEIEDYGIQANADVSPPKWHLAHTTWFFEDFILMHYKQGYQYYLEDARKLFNSYYETLSKPFPKSKRGLVSRPTVKEVMEYRHAVDKEIIALLSEGEDLDDEFYKLIELGINHEQQHQELLITDMKYNFSENPIQPAYKEASSLGESKQTVAPINWSSFEEGLATVGSNEERFKFDNEEPAHKHYLYPFSIADRPVTNGEFMKFIEVGGYSSPEYWLSDGWATVGKEQLEAPLYWEKHEGSWYTYTLFGLKEVNQYEPVTHISFYEADAYARWAGFRLPTEQEWEHAFKEEKIEGSFLENFILDEASDPEKTVFGSVWEWTKSPYVAYPESARPEGALGEYNAKFMSNQMVLRGGSCATPRNHVRLTYRNFFHPDKRWQFSGLRLAKDGK
ncbi:ergothioneine biosynthesis protein EgtB [Salipaludibacillus sp. CF4.18]|uniref:ergothioneine biosynthesis protein EgtB n=1 Tax=Salipaludibacillus sp. CF4.18 TaxID=3373081 RepID=UPI003EE50F98